MRVVQILVQKLISLALLVGGVLMVVYPADVMKPQIERYVMLETPLLRVLVGVVVGILALIAFLPPLRRRKAKRAIQFDGPHGSIAIQLDSIEAALNHSVAEMPEVRKINLHVTPAVNDKKVRVEGDAVLYRCTELGARETSKRISDNIHQTATQLLGMQELAAVDVTVTSILDKPSPKLGKAAKREAALTTPPPKKTEARPQPKPAPPEEEEDEDYVLPPYEAIEVEEDDSEERSEPLAMGSGDLLSPDVPGDDDEDEDDASADLTIEDDDDFRGKGEQDL